MHFRLIINHVIFQLSSVPLHTYHTFYRFVLDIIRQLVRSILNYITIIMIDHGLFFHVFRYLTIGHHLISQLCTSQKYKVHIQRVHVMQDLDTFLFLQCRKIYILNHWTIFFELQCGIPLVPCSSHDLQDSNNRGMGEEGATLYDGALTGNSIVLHSGRGAVRQRSYIVAFLSADTP